MIKVTRQYAKGYGPALMELMIIFAIAALIWASGMTFLSSIFMFGYQPMVVPVVSMIAAAIFVTFTVYKIEIK